MVLLGPFNWMPYYGESMPFSEVKPATGLAATASAQGRALIRPHTDGPMYLVPPQWVVLYAEEVGRVLVPTGLAPAFDFVATLEAQESSLLWLNVPFFKRRYAHEALWSAELPILGHDFFGQRFFRFSDSSLRLGTSTPSAELAHVEIPAWTAGFAKKANAYFDKHQVAYAIPRHYALIWNNLRFVHFRKGNVPPDVMRTLIRYWFGNQPGTHHAQPPGMRAALKRLVPVTGPSGHRSDESLGAGIRSRSRR